MSFSYKVVNTSDEILYVIDAMAALDQAIGKFKPDPNFAVTIAGEDGIATLAKTVPPMPSGRRLAALYVPLAVKLLPRAHIERTLKAPLPWAESSPYFPDLSLREYALASVKTVIFAVGYWCAGDSGLIAAESNFAPGLYQLVSSAPVASARHAVLQIPTRGLDILRRGDEFPRDLKLV